MNWHALADTLFGPDHGITERDLFLDGTVSFGGVPLKVIGTTGHAPIGVALALAQARAVLDTLAALPGRPILLLIDTQGQQLRLRDELLGINRAMAHLGCCIDLARRQGHRVVGLVYDQALSGGFITSGLIADACHALPEAEIRVMRLPGDGPGHQDPRGAAGRAVRGQPGVRAGGRELRGDGRRAQRVGRRPARGAGRGAAVVARRRTSATATARRAAAGGWPPAVADRVLGA